MTTETRPFHYRPEIDGLRAVAILAVMACHLGAVWLPGGFVGVDVFFVISGYLITGIILKENSIQAFRLQDFWLRRVRRILPAMLLMLLVTLTAGYVILLGADRLSLGWQSISALLLSANIKMWDLAGNYWAPSAGKIPLLHTWSLSVEEQFYLIYPLFILTCLKWFPRRLPLCLAAVLALSLAACIRITFGFSSAAFYSLSTRAWELAAGCFLAALDRPQALEPPDAPRAATRGFPALDRSLAAAGLALIAASCLVINADGFPGYQAGLPVFGAMFGLRFAGSPGCPVASLLSFPIMRFIGRISYSLYLWHWPVIVLGRAAQARWENLPAWPGLVLIPVLAVASYYAVERPGRRLRNPLPFVLPGLGAAMAVSACLALLKTYYDTGKFLPTVWMGDAYSVTPFDPAASLRRQPVSDGITAPPRDPKYTNAFTQGGMVKQYGGEKVDLLVLGDSHALMWAPVIDEICQDARLTVIFDAVGGVDPVPSIPPQRKAIGGFSPEEWVFFESNRMSLIRERHPRLIVIASRWSPYALDYKLNNFLEEVSRINQLSNTNQRSEVLFIEDPPEWVLDGLNAPQFCSTTSDTAVKPRSLPAQLAVASRLRTYSQSFAGVHTLETADLYSTKDGLVKVREDNAILYFDGNHLSLAGARLAKERIMSAVTNIIGKPAAH